MLARWLLDAGFLAILQPVLRFMVPMGVIWHAWCLYFGVLEVPGTILGRSWDDPGTLEGTRKGPVRSRLGFYRFFGDFGTHSESFFVLLDKRNSFFHIYFQVAFSVGFWV